MAIIRINVPDAIRDNPEALQQVIDQIIDQLDNLDAGGGQGDVYTLEATEGDGEVTVELSAEAGESSDLVLKAGTGMTITEAGGVITFVATPSGDEGDFVVFDTENGEVKAGDEVTGYLYRYLHIRFSVNSAGSNFTTDPATIDENTIYIGLHNSNSLIAPIEAAAYSWTGYNWDSDGDYYVHYKTLGARNITFITSDQEKETDAIAYDENVNPLDLDNLMVTNDNIEIAELSDITADVGVLTTGIIRGGSLMGDDPSNISANERGAYMNLTNGSMLIGEQDVYFHFSTDDTELDIVGTNVSTDKNIAFSGNTPELNDGTFAQGLLTSSTGAMFTGALDTNDGDSINISNSTYMLVNTTTYDTNNDAVTDTGLIEFRGDVAFEGDSNINTISWARDNSELSRDVASNANIHASRAYDDMFSNTSNVIFTVGSDGVVSANAQGAGVTNRGIVGGFQTGGSDNTQGAGTITNNTSLTLNAGSYAIAFDKSQGANAETVSTFSGNSGNNNVSNFEETGNADFANSDYNNISLSIDGGNIGTSDRTDQSNATNFSLNVNGGASIADALGPLLGLRINNIGPRGPEQFDTTVNNTVNLQIQSNNSNASNPGDNFELNVSGIDLVNTAGYFNNVNTGNTYENSRVSLDVANEADSFLLNTSGLANISGTIPLEVTFTSNTGDTDSIVYQTRRSVNVEDATPSFSIPKGANSGEIAQQLTDSYLTETDFSIFDAYVDVSNSESILERLSNDAYLRGPFVFSNNVNVNIINNAGSAGSSYSRVFFEENNDGNTNVNGGWFTGVADVTSGVNLSIASRSIYDSESDDWDSYGQLDFSISADGNSNTNFIATSTNNNLSSIVESQAIIANHPNGPTSGKFTPGLLFVSASEDFTIAGEFYDHVEDIATNNFRVTESDNANVVFQYKEIT